jgi:hypothetical protein
MKVEIEKTLHPLIGEPLSDMWRYAGHQKFEFGIQRPCKNRKGEHITIADWGFVVAGDWRITGPEGYIVSSDDFGPKGSRRDEKAYPFYEMLGTAPPIVESIEAEEDGSVRFCMTGGYTLDVLPDREPEAEQWRFMPKDGRKRQFVITSEGIER